ncbi:helix-turn-helix transcriptional regulator [Acidisoma cellulosilytica]|uniref:Helix-turn-helix transcriptional regulator n=1 Tax=Acidisoma cellulosilyticum TaxID=2802395 RepID=A0A963Z012_9PROT|nr:AraC family transcriptional regulator [Acidisoma cellulosilyticum]MCB8879338.1 helix-turn-helix transcriptional regulator [Acidisoma cellulosilyticum]
MSFEANPRNEAWKRLLPLAPHDARAGGSADDVPSISAFVARQREHFKELTLPTNGLIVLLEGKKEVRFGIDRYLYRPGEAFVALAGAVMDVTNFPDTLSEHYRALFVRLPRSLMIEAARRWPQFSNPVSPPHLSRLPVDAILTDTLIHAVGRGYGSGQSTVSQPLAQHRFLEIVLVLAERGAISLTPKYAEQSFADALRQFIRHRLHHPWTAAEVAQHFGCSVATLRRRLLAEGQSFAKLLLAERMAAARILLTERGAEVADTLAATGFASRSHFAVHYRRLYGETPSSARARAREPTVPI